MRELRVEDALLYLDQVKVEFGDRPHIYNEFLEIMKTFKTQQIDTPGVIRRVSNLFKGNRRLVLGFNTFLPEGYQIELPSDGNGPPVAVYRAPGSNVAQILREGDSPQMPPAMPQKPPSQPAQQGHPSLLPHGQPQIHQPPHGHSPALRQPHGQHHLQIPHAARLPQAGEVFAQNLAPQVMTSHVTSQAMLQRQQHPLDQRQLPAAGLIRPNQASSVPPAQQSPSATVAARDAKPPAANDGATTNGSGGGARPPKAAQPPAAAQAQQPMEFDHAINYVTTIKKRFATEPEIYKKFLEILHTYQKEQRGIKEVLDEVSKLFADHPDLLKEFTYFLPDAVQGQAKAQLDQVAKEAEARKRAQAKQAILSTAHGMQKQAQNTSRSKQPEYDRETIHVPYGAVQGRTEEQEQMIIRGAHFGVVSFDAVRPPRRGDLTPSKAATKVNRPVSIPPIPKQPNTAEAAFLQKTKKHLERRELRSDKPTGSRRHTPYVEFLKCLHLFGAGVLSRDELLMFLKSLFMYGHAPKSGTSSTTGMSSAITSDANELIRDLEQLMNGRGKYAVQQSALKDKSKYGSVRTFDFDLSNCDNHTPCYYSYPSDYPHSMLMSHAGQTKWEKQVLNETVLCVGKIKGERNIHSIEAYDGIAERHNAYEEAMMRIEEERYEIDMAIERNAQALRQIEPLAEEVQALKEQEEKDGQPIGRLQYRLNRHTLNSVHTNAIARLYGDRGDEVLQHLLRNPLAVLPIVYQRLKQKDTEWRKAKVDRSSKLNASTAANYEGTLDTQCYFKRKAVERLGTLTRLRDDCIRARSHARSGESKSRNPAVVKFLPDYATSHPDSQALLFQSYASVKAQLDVSHRDVFSLVSKRIELDSGLSSIHRERIGRIWAEFVVPWFDYPPFWVADELRKSFSGTLCPNVVKCKFERLAEALQSVCF
jgi:paired amphipathic helix protein Sin3a